MDSKDSKLVEEKETTLQELLEEVPMVETSLNNPGKNLNSKYAVVVNWGKSPRRCWVRL